MVEENFMTETERRGDRVEERTWKDRERYIKKHREKSRSRKIFFFFKLGTLVRESNKFIKLWKRKL